MLCTVEDMVKVNKGTLFDIQNYLQNAQKNIDFLQLESQLQRAELQQWSHHFEHVSIQNNETNSHKQQVNNVTNSTPMGGYSNYR